MTKTWKTTLALLSIGLLAVAAVAVPAAAKPGDDGDHAGDHRAAAQEKMQQHRDAAAAHAEAHGNVTKERCLAAQSNHTLNASAEERCMKVGEFAEKAFKARRAAHALLGAINATERQWARLNATEADLQAKLAAGNLTANQTAAIEKRLERIDAKQDRLEERLAKLKERLGKLHDKWAAVREHVADERRRHHEEDEDDASGSGSVSSSQSQSASESSSESVSESSSSGPA